MIETHSNTITIEIEDGDTAWQLHKAVGRISQGAVVRWIPLGHNRPGLLFTLPED